MEMCSSSFTFDFDSKGTNDLLLGDLIAEGCTAGYGNVDYIFFGNILSPELFVDRYLNHTENYNLAESFYMAGRTLSWQTVLIGDPKSSIVIDNTASILEGNQVDFKIYPNPFHDQLTISSNKMIYSGQIINLNGALIREFSILENGETELDLSNLKVGTYILKIVGNKKVFQKLILKNH